MWTEILIDWGILLLGLFVMFAMTDGIVWLEEKYNDWKTSRLTRANLPEGEVD